MPTLRRSSVLCRLLSVLVLVAFLLPGTTHALSPSALLTNFPTERQAP